MNLRRCKIQPDTKKRKAENFNIAAAVEMTGVITETEISKRKDINYLPRMGFFYICSAY